MDKSLYQVDMNLRIVMSEEDKNNVLSKAEELLYEIKKLVKSKDNASSVDASISVKSGFVMPTNKYSQIILSLKDSRGDRVEVLLTLDGFGRWIDLTGEEWGVNSILSGNPIIIHSGYAH